MFKNEYDVYNYQKLASFAIKKWEQCRVWYQSSSDMEWFSACSGRHFRTPQGTKSTSFLRNLEDLTPLACKDPIRQQEILNIQCFRCNEGQIS